MIHGIETAIWYLGAFSCGLTFLVGALVVVAYLCSVFDQIRQRIEVRAEELTRRRIGADLMRDSWWFTEDRETTSLLQDIASGLRDGSTWSVDRVREDWRKRRKAALQPAKDSQ